MHVNRGDDSLGMKVVAKKHGGTVVVAQPSFLFHRRVPLLTSPRFPPLPAQAKTEARTIPASRTCPSMAPLPRRAK